MKDLKFSTLPSIMENEARSDIPTLSLRVRRRRAKQSYKSEIATLLSVARNDKRSFLRSFLIPFALCPLLLAGKTWIETSQRDFADGYYEHNIYASHRSYKDSLPGAIEFVQRFDYNNDGWMDVVVSNVGPYSGPFRESVFVYLQYPGGGFLKDKDYKRLCYPTGAAGDVVGADLNTDGIPELIVQNFWYYPVQPGSLGGISIFWGTDSFPDPSHYDSLGPYDGRGACAGVYVVDLNKDGYLDIIGGMYPGPRDFSIFWGSRDGYSEENITTIKIPDEYSHSTHNFEVADFDKDGYYDIVVTCFVQWETSSTRVRPTWLIFWGDSAGYSETNATKFSVDDIQGHGATVADLNNDGWLDLVCTTYRSGYKDVLPDSGKAVIYYGTGNRQFSPDSTVLHPGYCFGGSAAADLYPRGNPDGWLDLIFFVGNIDEMTPSPYKSYLWLYYGGPDGFSDDKRESLDKAGREWSSSGGLIADFNVDGYQDIFADDWATQDGYSGVLYGPDFERIEELPNHTDHHGTPWEVGNTYDRKYYEEYISSVYDAKEIVSWSKFSAIIFCPEGTRVSLAFRRGDTPKPDNSWSDWYLPNCVEVSQDKIAGALPGDFKARYIQYKATLYYKNPANLPILYEMRVGYDLPKGVEGSRVQERLTVEPSIMRNSVVIEYAISEVRNISLGIYDVSGRIVKTFTRAQSLKPKVHRIEWDGRDSKGLTLPRGVYFVILKTENKEMVRKIILIK